MRHVALEDLEGVGAPGTTARVMVDFARQADGAPECFPLIVVEGARPGPTAALVAGIHGDEYEGPRALWRLAETIEADRLVGRLLIVPIAHLAAFAAGTRTSPIDGQNLARIFPGDAAGTRTFRLAHALFEGVVAGADFLLDLHSGGVRLAFLDVSGFYGAEAGIDAALATHALSLAKDLGLAHLWRLPPRVGVLSFEAMRRGIAASGAESGGRGGCLPGDVDAYYAGLLRVLARRGMLDIDPGPSPEYLGYLEGDWVLAPAAGFIDNHVELGQRVASGDALATISTPLGEPVGKLSAAAPGIVMAVRHLRSIDVGEWATCAAAERFF